MKTTIWTILLWGCIALGYSQAQQTRPLSAFTELEVTDKINVKLVPSERDYLEINGELGDKLELVQQNDALRFKMALGYQLQGGELYVTLYYSSLARIVARKGAIIHNENTTFEADTVFLSANEGSKIVLNTRVNRLGLTSSTGATVQLLGETKIQEANIALGGFYYGKQLSSEQATVTVHAGGRAEINVTDTADLQTRAGGVIDVYGNPTERKERKFAGGKINFMN